jgi:hypothetical protein
MTFATFPRELFAIPELGFDREAWVLPNRPSALFADDSDVVVTTDSHSLEGSQRVVATARKIFHVAKSRYGWSDRTIEQLLHKFHENSSFDGLDSIAKNLILAEASYNIAWLSEKSSDFSYWINLSPHQREVLFSCADRLRDDIAKFSSLNLREILDLFKCSLLFNIDFKRFFFDCLDNHKKVIDNADRMAGIFEKREGNQPRVLNFSKMTQAQRDAAIENYRNSRQVRIDRLSAEQLAESNKQFERVFAQLDESRN